MTKLIIIEDEKNPNQEGFGGKGFEFNPYLFKLIIGMLLSPMS